MTRTRILEALVRTMANGVAALSMPAVAREAGVSVPTVYRHFGSKAGLVAALGPYVARKAGLWPTQPITSVDEAGAAVREIYGHLEQMDDTLRAAMASELGQQARRATMPERRRAHRDAVRATVGELPNEVIERLTDLSIVLFSSAAFRAFKDYLGLSADEAADRASWALRMLFEGARRLGAAGVKEADRDERARAPRT